MSSRAKSAVKCYRDFLATKDSFSHRAAKLTEKGMWIYAMFALCEQGNERSFDSKTIIFLAILSRSQEVGQVLTKSLHILNLLIYVFSGA